MNANRLLKHFPSRGPGSQRERGGLSVLEFIGCLIALVGGIWLGAIYLGIDMRQVAHEALTESDLMDKVPEGWRPVDPAAENAPSHEELAEKAQQELLALREEISAFGTTPDSQPAATKAVDQTSASAAEPANPEQPAKQATLAYWSRLHEIVQNQAALQREAEAAATEGSATKLAAIKGRIGRFSADAIRALPKSGVDPAAVDVAKELANWYEQGAGVYELAVQVWGTSPSGQGGPQITKEWEHARAQHLNEGRLLVGRVAAARDSLTRRFGEGFAPITGI